MVFVVVVCLLVKNSSFDIAHQFYVCWAISCISRLCFWSVHGLRWAPVHCLDLLSFHSTSLARHVLVFLIFAEPVLFHWYFCVCHCGFSCLFCQAVALFLFKTLGVRAILLASLFSFLMWALSTGSFPSSPALWHPSCFHRLWFHSTCSVYFITPQETFSWPMKY